MLGIYYGAALGMIVTSMVLAAVYWRQRRSDLDQHTRGGLVTASTPEPVAGKRAMFVRLISVLNRHAPAYCMLHGYEQFPDFSGSDIDCLMPAEFVPRGLAEMLHRNAAEIGARSVLWVRGETEYVLLAGRDDDCTPCFLPFDVSGDYQVAGRTFYQAGEVLDGCRAYGDVPVPRTEIEFGCYLARRIAKGQMREDQGRKLSRLFGQDAAGCRRQIHRFWKGADAEAIATAAQSGDWSAVQRDLPRLRRGLRWRMFLRQPLRTIGGAAARFCRRLGRWCRADSGVHVVLLGPDGAGKSTLAGHVLEQLGRGFACTKLRSFPPALLQRGAAPDIEPLPHAVAPRSYLNSMFRAVAYWFVYYGPGYYLTTWPALVRNSLVLHDRHLVDVLVDAKRYRYSGPKWLIRFICAMIPKPHLFICLDAPAEVIQKRKREVPLEVTARQVAEYRKLVGNLRGGHIVDANRPARDVVADVNEIILKFLSDRVARRLKLGATN